MQITKTFLFAVSLATLAIGLVALYLITRERMPDNSATNGAYRDGLYLGTRTAERGELPHIAIGRWSKDSDRNSFGEGYKEGYGRALVSLDQNTEVSLNTSAAYRDGLYLGKRDAEQGREQHVTSGRWAHLEDRELFTSGYRQAYFVETAMRIKQMPRPSLEPNLAN